MGREVNPRDGQFSAEAAEILQAMLEISAVKFHPNLMMANWLLYNGAQNHTMLRDAKRAFKATLKTVDIPPDAVEMMDKFSLICELVLQAQTQLAIDKLGPLVHEHSPLQQAAYHLQQTLKYPEES